MGRPARFDADRLLDAAVAVVAERGPRALTVAAVARAASAPNGSVYHRFPSQAALLAALWLRTVARFQSGFLAALGGDPPLDAAVAAARHVLEWSRQHPAQAQVLLAGPRELGESTWTSADRRAAREGTVALTAALTTAAARLGARRLLVLAVIDLPYAVVRRHLAVGTFIPPTAADDVADAARTLLTGPAVRAAQPVDDGDPTSE